MTKEEFIERWHPTIMDTNGIRKMDCNFESDLGFLLADMKQKHLTSLKNLNDLIGKEIDNVIEKKK